MKFKKFLALSLAAAMMTTGIPGVGMLDGAVNVMAATTPTPTAAITVVDIADTTDDIESTFTTESTKSTLTESSGALTSTYSGENIDPVPSLKVGTTELYLNRDYTYSYIKVTDRGTVNQKVETVSSITDAGDYEIKFTFKGTYSGHGTATVKLTVAQAATNSVIVTSSNSKVTDGYLVNADDKVKEPEVTVYAPDGKTALKKGIDYNVTYTAADGINGKIGVEVLATSNNIMAGTYNGNDELDYYVVKTIKDTDISIALAKNADGTYKVTPTLALGGSAGTEWNYTIVDASSLTDKTTESVGNSGALGAGEYIITVTGVVAKGYNGTTIQKRFTISENTVELTSSNTTIQYNGKASYVYTGKEIKPDVTVIYTDDKNVKKDITSSVDVKWTNNINATTWNEDGDITSALPEVTVSGKGNYIGTITKDNLDDEKQCIFEIKKADFEDVEVSVASLDFNGENQVPEVKQFYNDNDITSTSGNTVDIYKCNVDSVTGEPKQVGGTWATGSILTIVNNAGYYVAKVTSGGNFNISTPKEVVFQVKPYNISGLKAVINGGNPLTTGLTANDIVFKNGNEEFKMAGQALKNTDFDIKSDDKGKAGNYTVEITGKANYTGTLTANYSINEVVTPGNIKVYTSVDKDASGNVIYTPHVNVYDNNNDIIPESSYTLKYYSGTSISKETEVNDFGVGTYSAVVIPKGLYEGQKYNSYLESYYTAVTFDIDEYKDADAEKNLNAAVITGVADAEYTGSAITPATITVKDGEGNTVLNSNYTVVCSNNVNVGTATVTVYAAGSDGYFGSTSTTFEITPKTLTGLTARGITYGSKVKDSDIINLGSGSLEFDKDFNVVYAKAVLDKAGLYTYNKDGSYITEGSYTADTIKDAGKYIAICEGVGNYKGTMQIPFDVNQLDLATLTVVFDSMNYTGNKVLPTFTATNGTDEIVLSPEDYVVETYTNSAATNPKDAINPGKYYARVIAKDNGNLKSKTDGFTFAIKAADLSKAKISVEAQTYTGEEIKPEISVTLDGNEVSSDLYEVTYADNIEVGTATVTVTAKGENVTGTVTESFKINAIDLSDATVSDISAKTYNGKKQKPDVTVTLDGKVLEEGEDFSVSYKNNTSAGKATVKVSGIGNYKGSVAKTFTINRAGQKITVKGTSKTYKVKTLKAKKATFKLSATAKGSVSFKKLSSGKKVTVSKNGTVTVAKGLKKGTYKIKVKATAAATKTNYKAASKTFTVTVKVK